MNHKWTAEMIAYRAGLEPFDDFRKRMLKESHPTRLSLYTVNGYRDEFERCTGRTTKLCCQAIAETLNGKSIAVVCSYPTQVACAADTTQDLIVHAGLTGVITTNHIQFLTRSEYVNSNKNFTALVDDDNPIALKESL